MTEEERARVGVGQVLAERGIKQGWLARQVGVSDPQMSRMLANTRRWTEERKGLAARALGIPVEMLFAALDIERPGGYPTVGQMGDER